MIKGAILWGALLSSASTSVALAQSKKVVPPKVLQGPLPKWVLPQPEALPNAVPADAPIQVHFFDNQVRVSKKGQERFISQRFKMVKPEALQAANLNFTWRPSSGTVTVHSVRLIRKDGSSADMLGKANFIIVQREANLEQSVLTGLATAVFAIPGAEVGDDVEFSATIADRDPTFGEKAFGALQLPTNQISGTFRARLIQSDGAVLRRKVTADLESPDLTRIKTLDELLVKIDNPTSMNFPEGAPARYGVGRLIEYSSFSGWPEISSAFWRQFEKATTLGKDAPVRSEIAKIAAASTDPQTRAQAALKMVQDRVRYVFVGFGTGNYTPATADETWERRYGDCKGKTALLLAILRELGISAEPVLVNQGGLDGMQNRLASPGLFDHVLVRSVIGAKSYWLDGTQLNGPKFAFMPQPDFRTALPLRASGAGLEDVPATPLTSPALIEIVDIDASTGTEKPSRVSVWKILHGSGVAQLRSGLASLAGDDLKRALRGMLAFGSGNGDGDDTSWSYDDSTGALTLEWSGMQKLDWEGDTAEERYYVLPGAGFTPPSELKRPKEQDQSAPWAVDFPSFNCWVTTVRLPPDQERLRWTYLSKPVNRVLGGLLYFRQATVRSGIIQTVMSKRALQAELSPAEAREIEAALPDFDNEKSMMYRERVGPDAGNTDDRRSTLEPSTIDWASAAKVCQPPPPK